jgi:prophage antirepressor-like protein
MTIINESGLYFVILRCQSATRPGSLPYRFRKWVTAEVLPAIRKTGSYGVPEAAPAATDEIAPIALPFSQYNDLVLQLVQQQERISHLEKRVSRFETRRFYMSMVQVLIRETNLSDEDIALRLEEVLGDYMPEWVAWNRRLINGIKPS